MYSEYELDADADRREKCLDWAIRYAATQSGYDPHDIIKAAQHFYQFTMYKTLDQEKNNGNS